MKFDLRLPVGLMFAVFGLHLNLWWGLVQLVFGGSMLFFGRRGSVRG